MLDRTTSELSTGALWRDVVNYLAESPISPAAYLPLADAVLPKWDGWTYFLGRAASALRSDRDELEADAARAQIGWRMWTEQREDLRKYAETITGKRVDDQLLERWWLYDESGDLWLANFTTKPGYNKHLRDFRRLMRLSSEDERAIRHHPDMAEPHLDYWMLSWVHWNLRWTKDLERLRDLGHKTWPADARRRERWTPEELDFVNAYFEEQQPYLMTFEKDGIPLDPFELEVSNTEQGLGFGLDGLRYLMYVLVRAVVVDFAEAVLERTRRPAARGSLACIECDKFVGRRALGYGQLYCSDRCKKRAAKRRYRQRVAQSRADSGAAEISAPSGQSQQA